MCIGSILHAFLSAAFSHFARRIGASTPGTSFAEIANSKALFHRLVNHFSLFLAGIRALASVRTLARCYRFERKRLRNRSKADLIPPHRRISMRDWNFHVRTMSPLIQSAPNKAAFYACSELCTRSSWDFTHCSTIDRESSTNALEFRERSIRFRCHGCNVSYPRSLYRFYKNTVDPLVVVHVPELSTSD